jgi:hypothetical protein
MLAGEVIVAMACINFLWLILNVSLTVVNQKRAKATRMALEEATSTLNELQKRLTELNSPTYKVCGTCGRIVQGECDECPVLSKLIG